MSIKSNHYNAVNEATDLYLERFHKATNLKIFGMWEDTGASSGNKESEGVRANSTLTALEIRIKVGLLELRSSIV